MTVSTSAPLALIASRWHSDIVDRGVASFREQIATLEPRREVEVHTVPGAFEIPLLAKRLAATGRYAAVAACGLVVDGGIYRHDFVASAVINALMRVQLEADVPVFTAVLTPHHFHEHAEHADFFVRHLAVKGAELATAVIDTLAAHASAGVGTPSPSVVE